MEYLTVLSLGLLAGTLGGVIGTGSSLLLLPVLVFMFGPKQAVPIMAIASVMANVGRLAAWWRDVNWRAFTVYSLGGVPAATLGAKTLIVIPDYIADLILGLFFLALLPARQYLRNTNIEPKQSTLFLCGIAIGFLTGLVQSTGPLSIVIFSIFGLARGALLATEAATSLAIYSSKTSAFGVLGILNSEILIQGFLIGLSLVVGAFTGKAVVMRIGDQHLTFILDLVIMLSGSTLVASAAWSYFY